MVKIAALPLLFLTSIFGLSTNVSKDDFKAALNVTSNERGNYTLVSIDDSSLEDEPRIYRYDDQLIDEIADNAFSGISFTSVAISNCVTLIGTNAFAGQTSLTTCNFTGSEEEWNSLNVTYVFNRVNYYAIDEGFINYWVKEVRPTADTNICEITKDQYNYIRELYSDLSAEDKAVVDVYEDLQRDVAEADRPVYQDVFQGARPEHGNPYRRPLAGRPSCGGGRHYVAVADQSPAEVPQRTAVAFWLVAHPARFEVPQDRCGGLSAHRRVARVSFEGCQCAVVL